MKELLARLSINNLFAGFIVAVVALPLCIAFAIASGASPMGGIVSGVLGGFLAAAFGSSRFQVSGPAAAFVTILYGIIAQHGLPVLLACTFVAGAVVIAIALLKLGKLTQLMPHSVIVGFTTGIGVLILLGQLPGAVGIAAQGKDVMEKLVYAWHHLAEANQHEFLVLAATLAAALLWGRTRLARWVPAPLVALIAGAGVAQTLAGAGVPVRTIGSLYDLSVAGIGVSASFLGSVYAHLEEVLLAGFTLGFLIAVESLLSAKALDAMTGTRHDPDRELVGLGLANLVVPFFGGIPVSGVIVRGSTNVMGGATGKSAALLHSVFLALFVAALYDYIRMLPMAALAAVLLLTARRLIEVQEIRRILQIDPLEGALALLTVVLTVTIDLTVSVPAGVVLMLLVALKRMLEERRLDVCDQHGHSVLAVNNSLTFLTCAGVKKEMEHHLTDPRVRALNLLNVHFIDSSGAVMVAEIMERNPLLEVWVASEHISRKLGHAGVDQARIAIMGNRLVNLPAVFRHIQGAAA